MSAKKSFVLRIDESVYQALEKWASDEFRSVNGQIEWIVSQKLKEAGRLKEKNANKGKSTGAEQSSDKGEGSHKENKTDKEKGTDKEKNSDSERHSDKEKNTDNSHPARKS